MFNGDRSRFLDGLAAETGLDRALLDSAGTTVFGAEDRAGLNGFAAYWVGERALIWADPAIVDSLRHLADGGEALGRAALRAAATAGGYEPIGSAVMRVATRAFESPAPLAAPYRHERPDSEGVVDRVRSLAERCTAEEVDAAALDELDDFAEEAINLVTIEEDAVVAYASAGPWAWDPGFGDIGVLVDPAHRAARLGTFTVVGTCIDLLAADRLPLYRHDEDNVGSARLAAALGFEIVARLDVFARPDRGA